MPMKHLLAAAALLLAALGYAGGEYFMGQGGGVTGLAIALVVWFIMTLVAWFQGDNVTDGPRTAGLVFTEPNVKSVVTGNYIDNSFIEWKNEHDEAPDFSREFSLGGLTITGNIFTVNDAANWLSWIRQDDRYAKEALEGDLEVAGQGLDHLGALLRGQLAHRTASSVGAAHRPGSTRGGTLTPRPAP